MSIFGRKWETQPVELSAEDRVTEICVLAANAVNIRDDFHRFRALPRGSALSREEAKAGLDVNRGIAERRAPNVNWLVAIAELFNLDSPNWEKLDV